MLNNKRTKIVCTIGPASEKKEVFTELVKNGLNVARLNFSHGSHEEHLARINMIKEVREELKAPIAILLDTKGPEIRTGKFSVPVVKLEIGDMFTLTTEDILGDEKKCSISYKELPKDVKKGNRILIDDGLVELEVQEIIDNKEILCKVNNGGEIKNNKGVNVPGVKINLPAITQKDIDDIKFGIENGIDFIAASFIRKVDDVLQIRKILEENNGTDIQIISKIENQEGVDNLDDIINISDGIMVARGDLGVEIPTETMPIVQKTMIRKCNEARKVVITATQMLDSMIRNPRPTRAETTDVANAIFDGTDAIMLSGETAAGSYPIEAVRTMSTIARATEEQLNYKKIISDKSNHSMNNVTYAISHATVWTAYDLNASAIITATHSGYTAKNISNLRPKSSIIAATVSESVRRKLALWWGVESIIVKDMASTEEMFDNVVERVKEEGYIEDGEMVIITAGVPIGMGGTTNILKAHLVGEILLKGLGIGKKSITSKVCICKDADEANSKLNEGDILVVKSTDADMMDAIKKASALIVEEGGFTSHAAIVSLNLNIPVVVGAKDAVTILKNVDTVTLDSERGIVYGAKSRLN